MTRKRDAFSLIEVMIALLIASLLVMVTWRLFTMALRQFNQTQGHMEAIQVAQLSLERIENDLRGMALRSKDDPSVFASKKARPTMAFFVSANAGQRGRRASVYQLKPVTYELRQVPGKPYGLLTRNGKGIAGLYLKDLRFEPVAIESMVGKEKLHFLRVDLTATDVQGKKSLVLQRLVSLGLLSRTRRGRHWQPNDYPYRSL